MYWDSDTYLYQGFCWNALRIWSAMLSKILVMESSSQYYPTGLEPLWIRQWRGDDQRIVWKRNSSGFVTLAAASRFCVYWSVLLIFHSFLNFLLFFPFFPLSRGFHLFTIFVSKLFIVAFRLL